MMKQSKASWLDYVRNYRFHSKLILQMIVENAVSYGIKPYEGKGIIEIKAYEA